MPISAPQADGIPGKKDTCPAPMMTEQPPDEMMMYFGGGPRPASALCKVTAFSGCARFDLYRDRLLLGERVAGQHKADHGDRSFKLHRIRPQSSFADTPFGRPVGFAIKLSRQG